MGARSSCVARVVGGGGHRFGHAYACAGAARARRWRRTRPAVHTCVQAPYVQQSVTLPARAVPCKGFMSFNCKRLTRATAQCSAARNGRVVCVRVYAGESARAVYTKKDSMFFWACALENGVCGGCGTCVDTQK